MPTRAGGAEVARCPKLSFHILYHSSSPSPLLTTTAPPPPPPQSVLKVMEEFNSADEPTPQQEALCRLVHPDGDGGGPVDLYAHLLRV